MNVRSSTKPPRPLSNLSKNSPLVKPHSSPRTVANRLSDLAAFPKSRTSPKTPALKSSLSSPSPSSSSRSSPHLGASRSSPHLGASRSSPHLGASRASPHIGASSSSSLRNTTVPNSPSPTSSEERDVVAHANTDSLSLLLGLVTSPTVTSSTANTHSNNPATPTFTLGSSRLRRKPSSPQQRLRSAPDQLPSPRSSPQTFPDNSPRLGAFEHREGRSPYRRGGVSPRSGYVFSSPPTSSSVSPALLPATLSRDLSALLASPKPHELNPSSLKLLPRVSHSGFKTQSEAWPSKEDDNMFAMRPFSDLAVTSQEYHPSTNTSMRDSDTFMHFYPPSKLSESTRKGHLSSHQGDSFGRNTHTLSVQIKAGMDKYLKGTFDPQSNMILGRGEFNEDLTQDIVTALAFSHDFSPIAIAYMHLYLREWKDASRKVARLPVPMARTLPFGRPYSFQGVQLLPCERDGEYVVEAGLSQHQLEDFEDRITDFRIWIKVVLEDPDNFKPQDAPYLPIKGFALSRSHGATLHDVWQTCQAFSMLVQELNDLAIMDESISGSEAGEEPQTYGQWNGRVPEKLEYPSRKFVDRGLYSRAVAPAQHDYNNYGSDDNGPPKRPLGSNKTIVKHFNAVRAEKAERAEARNLPPKVTTTTSSRPPRLKEHPKEIIKAEARRPARFSSAHDGNLSDASNSSSTPVFQPSVTTQIISPHADLDQARLGPMVMRTKPSFTADLESHHNVHQKRSPLNPVPTVVAAIPRVGSPADSPENGRRWGYQWRQGGAVEFSHPAHNAHSTNSNAHLPSYPPMRSPAAAAERPATRVPSYSYPNFYQS